MPRLNAVFLTAGLLAGCPASAISQEPPLCEVGSSVIRLVYLHSTEVGPDGLVFLHHTGAKTRVEAALVGSSLIFLEECPASFIPAFEEVAKAAFVPEPELRQAWIEAVRSAARDSSNTEVRGLLAVARERVALLGDPSLNEFLDGVFEGPVDTREVDKHALESLYERQALATLMQYSECDGAGCFNASDNVLFLLGTHPVAVFRAMRADSAAAAEWLQWVDTGSFWRISEYREIREAARRAVLEKLAETKAPGFEREQRACENTLREIRFREVS